MGPAITDEQRQLLAFHNLRQGDLFVVEPGAQFFQIESDGLSNPRYVQHWGEGQVVTASPLVNFASLPAYFILESVDDIVPVASLLVVVWGFLAYWCARWAWEWTAPRVGRRPPVWTSPRTRIGLTPVGELGHWLSRTSVAHRWLLAVLSLLTTWQAWRVPRFDYGLWGEALAIQLTAIVASAAAVTAFWALLRLLMPAWVAHVGAAVLLTATPLAFWGTQIKYHGLMMCLVVFSLYFFTLGWKRRQLGWRALAIALSGLAVWNHLSGVFLVVGLGVAELVHAPWPRALALGGWRRLHAWREVRRPRAWSPRAISHAVALGALIVGLLPWMAYNSAVFGNPLTDHYFATPDASGLDEAVASGDKAAAAQKLDATQARYDQYYEHQRDFRDNVGTWRSTLAVYLIAHEVEGAAVGVLALTPVLVLAVAAPLAVRWKRGSDDASAPGLSGAARSSDASAGIASTPPGASTGAMAWSPAATIAVVVIIVNWFFYVQRGPFHGAGYDLRYFTMSVPCLLLLAMMGLKWAMRDGRALVRAGATAYATTALLVLAFLLVLAHKNILLDWRDEFRQTYIVMHVLGVAACAGILLAVLGRPWLGRHQQPVLGVYLGIGLSVSHLWLATTQVLFHTGVPAHDGYAAFNHILPLTHEVHELFRRWLIPPKWGLAA